MHKLYKSLIIIAIVLLGAIPVFAAPIYRIERSLLPETDSIYYLGTTTPSQNAWLGVITDTLSIMDINSSGSTRCLQITSAGVVQIANSACGSGGGGSGGGTWSTTTSQVSGQLINYPNNDTDIMVVGSNATTTGEFFYDPETFIGYLKGKFGIGTTSPYASLSVVGETVASHFTGTTTATSTFGGDVTLGLGKIFTGHALRSDASDGVLLQANNYTNVGIFGAGNSSNSTFYGGVNIDGTTRLATSLTGALSASAGAVSAGTLSVGNGGTGATSFTTGSIPFSNGTILTEDNANLFWDDTNNRLGVGSTTPYATLSVVNLGSTPSFIVEDTTTELTPFVVDSAGIVGIGTYSPSLTGSLTRGMNIVAPDNVAELRLTSYRGSGPRALLKGQGALGSSTVPTAVITGTSLFRIDGDGWTGSQFNRAAEIEFFGGTGTIADNTSMPGRILFSTSPDGTIATTEKFRIDSTNVIINEASLDHDFRIESNDDANMFVIDGGTNKIGIATSTPYAQLSVAANIVASDIYATTTMQIPSGASPTVDAIGEIAFDTTTPGSFVMATSTNASYPAVMPAPRYQSFAVASTTWTSTSSLAQYPTLEFPERVNSGMCYTNAGTVLLRIGDGTNWSNVTPIGTATTTVTFTSNNRFNQNGVKVIYQIGTPASSPTQVNCTMQRLYERI